MGKVLVFQHVAWEVLGTLDPLLKERGLRIRYVNFERDPTAEPQIENYDALVILGGPMNVDEEVFYPHLTYELKAIEAAMKQQIPVLGICLGAQLIAKTLGARVYKNDVREIGWHSVALTPQGQSHQLFAGFSKTETLFHWHGDTFEIPTGSVSLASSELCPRQAFQFGDNVLGLQFHLEVNAPMLKRWLEVPLMRHDFSKTLPHVALEDYVTNSTENLQRLSQLSRLVFGKFFAPLAPSKQILLPSR